jgi:hypothetical protein
MRGAFVERVHGSAISDVVSEKKYVEELSSMLVREARCR